LPEVAGPAEEALQQQELKGVPACRWTVMTAGLMASGNGVLVEST